MRKKHLLLLASMVAVASFSGCSDKGNNTAENETTKIAEATTDSSSAESETNESETNDATDKNNNITETPTPEEEFVKKNIKDVGLSFSHEGGIYSEEFTLSITVDEGYGIFYTTDGSDPSTSSSRMIYTKPIDIKDRSGEANVVSAVSTSLFSTNFSDYSASKGVTCRIKSPSDDAVDKCTIIRAVAMDTNGDAMQTAGATYFIGTADEHIEGIKESCEAAGTPLAVISITMNYDDLFDHNTGIYVKGASFDKSLAAFVKQNKWFKGEDTRKLLANYSQRGREWEREAHVEMFEMTDATCESVFSQDCGIRIQGNYSRSDVQKGFRLYARSDYGASKFEYTMFGDNLLNTEGETIDKFDTFVLRAGGNCAFTAKYNDTYWQDLASELDLSTKASRPCVVYLNGEYWGLYVLEEDFSEDYFDDHYGVNKNDVVVYKGDAETYSIGYKLDEGELPEGESVSYYFNDLLDFFKNHDNLKSQEDYDEFSKLVDVQSVMDYFAVEVWINNKWDWPGKNWSMWKSINPDDTNEYNDGRWRFCLYDIEFGGVSGSSDAPTNTIKEDNYKPKGLLDFDTDNPAVLCFAYLMTNEGFRTEYCNKLLALSDTTFEKEHALSVLTDYEDAYGPLFDQFFERYPGTGSKDDALYGGYASSKCIRDFLAKRENNIQKMIDWVNRQY